MISRKFYLYVCFIVFGISQTPDHLIFYRISTGEYYEAVEIMNPTNEDIHLGDYYITDATKPADSSYYYNLPSGENFWSESISDFIARFPDTTIAAGGSFTLSFHDSSMYFNYYDEYPDFSLFGNMRNAIEGETTISYGPNFVDHVKLSNPAEVLILFKWEEDDSLVQDVDYFLWGNTTYGIDKTNIQGYLPDTPLSEQEFMPSTSNDKIYMRKTTEEYGELSQGGNGITGHDETSENLLDSWTILYHSSSLTELSDVIHGDPDSDVGHIVTIMGQIVEFSDKRSSNGPQIITIEDQAGYRMDLTIWDWDVEQSSIGYMMDYYNPAEYVIQARGTVDNYNGNWQVEIALPDDILEVDIYLKEGHYEPDSLQKNVSINPAPFVLIPSLGERLDYSYSFPDDSRVIVRIFDLGGRFVTTLVDSYFQGGGSVMRDTDNAEWDGRDHLGQIVSPGTYIMHIEANQFRSGKSFNDYAPVVVGVRSN